MLSGRTASASGLLVGIGLPYVVREAPDLVHVKQKPATYLAGLDAPLCPHSPQQGSPDAQRLHGLALAQQELHLYRQFGLPDLDGYSRMPYDNITVERAAMICNVREA